MEVIHRSRSFLWSLFAITTEIIGSPAIGYRILKIVSKALVEVI